MSVFFLCGIIVTENINKMQERVLRRCMTSMNNSARPLTYLLVIFEFDYLYYHGVKKKHTEHDFLCFLFLFLFIFILADISVLCGHSIVSYAVSLHPFIQIGCPFHIPTEEKKGPFLFAFHDILKYFTTCSFEA